MAVSIVQESSSISRCGYDVFLSFRGVDTRKNFTDHLYMTLVNVGIHTFRDDDEIERGEKIRDEIERAIYESKISIIIFSKNYASSTWCLNELVKIMEHRKFSKHIVLPIFYDVNPSQVKEQTGSFAEAFARHEESFKSEMDVVQRWRAALREVAVLGGMFLEDRYEWQFIQDIIKQVQNKLHHPTLYVPPCVVGIDSLVTCINSWLGDGSNKVGIATICGIGGIGKTTIAKVVYNLNIQRFESSSFLANVREITQEHNGLIRLQRQLLSDILKGKANKIYNSNDGITKIKEVISRRRVLFVLDDVDDSEKITKIIGVQIPFHPGSKIIITSRQQCLLSDPFIRQMFDLEASSSYQDLCKVFEVKELTFNESLQLFKWYAFRQNDPIDSYMEYARSIVKHCGGLPLALQVLGSSLAGKSINVWKSALEKLKIIPDSKIQKILKISYDYLQDDHDKSLFLDIACVFVGKDKDYTTTIPDGCDYYTVIGIENLINMSLLVVNEKNMLMMHQMIRDIGRNIIRQESPNLGKQSRLWHKDAFDALRKKIGTQTIKCLTMDLQRLLEEKYEKTIANHSKNPFLMSNEVDIEIDAFAKMQRLKLLQLDYVKLKGNYKDFLRSLIWLCWHGFPQEYLPTNLDISKLVVLEMCNSSLKCIWHDTKYFLPNLKILNLNHSDGLLKILNLSGLHSLERLMLKHCTKLIEVDQSIVMDYQLENGDLVSCKFATSGFNVREFGVTCVSETKIMYEDDITQHSQENEDIWREIELKVNEELLKLSSSGNFKVQIYNDLEESKMIASPKVFYDCGIISVYDIYGPPEDRYNYHAHPAIGNKISFVVAQSPGQHIGYLNLVAILFFENNEIFDFLYRIEIVNETKDTKWIHYKRFIGIPEIKNNICWFSSWRFMGELEDGDQVSCTVFSDFCIKEFIIDIIYEPDDNLLHKCNSGYQHLRGKTISFCWLFPLFIYHLFKSQRTLYRIKSLDKLE